MVKEQFLFIKSPRFKSSENFHPIDNVVIYMKDDTLQNMRQNYQRARLTEDQLTDNPYQLWQKWLDEAISHDGIIEPNMMTLATVGASMQPTCRLVLLKEMIENSFVWYTNYGSRKADDLEYNNKASLLFFWEPLERQVRIEGIVEKISHTKSEAYFNKRPLGSQVAASISPQSQKISYDQLKTSYDEMLKKSEDSQAIQCPENWGGYALKPTRIEFWQGGEYRLHDRWIYELEDSGWHFYRVGP